ncbi:hypothetical protein BCR36DRAFT_123516 [Piromyces finnis]|uniref:Uncharacterized protein n=1 Tax=Piromyces finnis TaxID=1754191 RepID=A0A1Y1V126_9FUNG|nr:hypothetical protein BCR36DRAFT_123516 [Piromyces finnis]|eukprot:ORX44863.1 hypothetical protein BCR36DRAFT_123516 [Piromyces finnis]
METLAFNNEIGLPEKSIDLSNDTNSDNTITNSVHSNQATPIQSQGIIYQQSIASAMSCEELKKLQRVNSNEKIHSPTSFQLTHNKNMNQGVMESPASVSTISSYTVSKSSENSRNSRGSIASNFSGVAILGQPIILTPENKKLLKKLKKGQAKNTPKLAILSNPALPTPQSSKKNSQEELNLENQKMQRHAMKEKKKIKKWEENTSSESETEDSEDLTTSDSDSEEEEDESIDNHDFSHIFIKRNDDEDDEEDDSDIDKEIIYPMKNGFILKDESENEINSKMNEEEKSHEDTDSNVSEEEKEEIVSKKKKYKKGKKSKKDKKTKKPKETEAFEEKKSEEPVILTENPTLGVEPEDVGQFNQQNKRFSSISMLSMPPAADLNSSFWSLSSGLPVQQASNDISGPIESGICNIDPNGSFYIPSPEQNITSPAINSQGISTPSLPPSFDFSITPSVPVDPNTSFWVPPPPSQADSTKLVVNIQGHQVPYEQIQQAYSFLGKNHHSQNQNPISEKIKSMNNTKKLVSFNSQEITNMPHSAQVKNTPPILETTGQPKGTAGVPSKSSRIIKAKQSLETAAVKRQSWCNVNSDILGNLQSLANRRSSSYPQLPRTGHGPLINIPMNKLLNRNFSGPSQINNHANVNNMNPNAYMNLPNPALINLPYGTIINANAYTTHNSVNHRTKKDEKGEEREDAIKKELNRQRAERVERWAQESKATMCPVKDNKGKSRRQTYSIDEHSSSSTQARGHPNGSNTSTDRSSESSAVVDDDDDDIPLHMISKNNGKNPIRLQVTPPSNDNKKRHSLVMKNSKDASMRHLHEQHRHSQILGSPSPSFYSMGGMGPVEVIPMPSPATSKKSKRRSYTPGMLNQEYPEVMMNYANGVHPAGYYQSGAAPVPPNVYGMNHTHTPHVYAHPHHSSSYENLNRAYVQNSGHHSRMYM